jgi:hypothetical protein
MHDTIPFHGELFGSSSLSAIAKLANCGCPVAL